MLKYLVFIATVCFFIIGCRSGESNFQITVDEVKEIVKTNHSYTIIDVRTPEETIEGVIDGAITIDVKADDFENKIKALDKNEDYIIYCRSGKRSTRAYEIMKQNGFTNVLNMEGGYLAYTEDE